MPNKVSPPPDRITGDVWGLDLGRRTGWAFGKPGEVPQSGTWEFDGDLGDACGGLLRNLQTAWKSSYPELVVAEAPLTLAAFLKLHSSEANVQMHFGMHAIVRGLVSMWPRARFVPANNATVRKHFMGVGRMGTRELTKAAVIHRCQILGLVPRTQFDEDRCDAIAVQDWAAFTFGQRAASISQLVLTGEQPR